MTVLTIAYPDDLLTDGQPTRGALEQLAREALIVCLYSLGQLSSGRAAQLLAVTRWAFLDLLGQYNVSYFEDTMDVAAEATHA